MNNCIKCGNNLPPNKETCFEANYGECNHKGDPDNLPRLRKQCKELMDDPIRGLRLSSNTNKTRYSLLALIEDAYEAGRNNHVNTI